MAAWGFFHVNAYKNFLSLIQMCLRTLPQRPHPQAWAAVELYVASFGTGCSGLMGPALQHFCRHRYAAVLTLAPN